LQDRPDGSTQHFGATDAADPNPGEQIGRYEVLRAVARGGMATVLAVRDKGSGEELAMKLLLPLTHAEEAKSRFRREFRALSRLQHPNILHVHEWGMRGERPWFTMELIGGRTLKLEAETLREFSSTDRAARSVHITVQVARALAYIHGRGLVHRDVTPGNIMVDDEGHVKLMDFGVVKDLGADLTVVGEVLGTAAYIAPEQIIGDSIDARADLYSLGAVLYLLLTGRRPFSALTMQGLLDKHMNQAPKSPRQHDDTVPQHLDEICMRLLSKDPDHRYASAAHLLHVLGDNSPMRGSQRFPPSVVGRTMAQATVRDAMDEVERSGKGAALRIVGSEGMGKSRLLDMAESAAHQRGLRVARSRCRPHDRPFGPFVVLYRALKGDEPTPVLDAVLGSKDEERVFERYPVLAAFRELVVQRAPCAILLDDVDRADAATADMIEYLIRNTLELANEPVVFVVGTGPAPSNLQDIDLVTELTLGPLQAAEVEELVLSVLDNTPAARALADRLFTESGGLPSYVADMLRGLIDEGALAPHASQPNRFRLLLDASEITQSRLPMPASMRQALEERIAPLTAAALEVARTVAVSRRSVDLDTLVEAALCDEDDVMDALDDLVDLGIVREKRVDDLERVELSQTRFRDVLLDVDVAPRHLQMGEALERSYRHRISAIVEELAFHFEQAGVAAKAYRYLLLTATRHLNRSLYEESLQFLDRALALEPIARPLMMLDEADRRLAELYVARSQARLSTGAWADALDDIANAESIAAQLDAPRLLSKIETEYGLQLRNLGRSDEAEKKLRQALKASEQSGDLALRPRPLYQLAGIIWGRGHLDEAQALWQESLNIAQQIGDERAQGSGYNGLGILAICQGRTMDARRHLEKSSELFERLGMLGPLAITRVNLVELYLSTGILKKAMSLADKTVAQAREVGHPHGIALGLMWRAQVLAAVGRLDDATRDAREALAEVAHLGEAPEDELQALATAAAVAVSSGEAVLALEYVERLLPLLAEHDYEGIGPRVTALHSRVLAELGRTEDARAVLSGARPLELWPHVQVRTDLAWARARRLLGDDADAGRLFKGALEIAESNGYRYYQLKAHHALIALTEGDERSRHQRVAQSLARSLSASLPRKDANGFTARFDSRFAV
jgi:tetratricopeptide (TPR) repeat protein